MSFAGVVSCGNEIGLGPGTNRHPTTFPGRNYFHGKGTSMVNVDNRPGGPRKDSNNTLYFIVGALVIAVLIIGWFMYGGDEAGDADVNVTTEEPATTPAAGGETNVTVEPAAPATTAPSTETNVTVEPAAPAATDTTGGATTGGATTGGATDTTGGATTGGATTGGATDKTGGTTGGTTGGSDGGVTGGPYGGTTTTP